MNVNPEDLPAIVGLLASSLENNSWLTTDRALWEQLGLLSIDGLLTNDGKRLLARRREFEYNCMIAERLAGHCFAPLSEDDAYDKLRRALGDRARASFTYLVRLVARQHRAYAGSPAGLRVCDLGGGSGELLKLFRDEGSGHLALVDRRLAIVDAGEFEQLCEGDLLRPDLEPLRFFVEANAGYFDVVLLVEVLHCLSGAEQRKVLAVADQLLRPGGLLVVGENRPEGGEVLLRRLRKLSHLGKAVRLLSREDVNNLVRLPAVDSFLLEAHHFTLYRKEKEIA